ncbi:MAG: hypothetical protein WCJ41_19540 [Aestuariivirga sp.]|jgi:hypothetical protein|uniref:hypothetical protein n=1 Tax=Aestuariivirga sp. TaxID=2650926 RepID=UPI00301982D5
MFDLNTIFDQVVLEDIELPIDHDFIIRFLAPYFPDLEISELEARLSEVISAQSTKSS